MTRTKKRYMKILSFVLVMALMAGMMLVNGSTSEAKVKKKIVVLYFSATGTTKGVAKRIKKATGGELIEIKAAEPYTDEDLDWGEEESRVTKEHESADSPAESSIRPEIKNLSTIKKAVKKADVVYIGYPIWWGEAPHIVYNLVEKVSLKKKTVVPFCTSMSSGLGKSAVSLEKKAVISSKTKWLDGRNYFDIPSQKKVNKWVKSLKY